MLFLAVIAVLLAGLPAHADIIEWRDADGVRHFTNLREEIPEAHRQEAQVVIDESVRRRAPDPPQTAGSEVVEEPRQAQVVRYRPEVGDAYREGFERGVEMARGAPVALGGDGGVTINGPLAIASAPASTAPFYLPAYGYPLVTSSFDRGRTRHMTLRMLMEDQFLVDREGPYAFFEAPRPAPGLYQFMPRGLPCGAACRQRVIPR